MKFFGNDGTPITTRSEWQAYGAPAGPHHWREGRSAYEAMAGWLEGDAVERVHDLLRTVPRLGDLELETATVEKKTRFDRYRGGPRNHDLLIVGTVGGERVVVAVEVKADEPFDVTLDDYLAKTRSPNSKATARLDALTTAFLGATVAEDGSIGALRYQLVAALAGTLADVQLTGAARAVLLVHEFVDIPKTYQHNHDRNAADLEAFLQRVAPDTPRHGDEEAWWRGPKTVRGTGELMPESAEVVFAKLRTVRR